MNNVTVKEANIHGKGVFAEKDFLKGETILQIGYDKPEFGFEGSFENSRSSRCSKVFN